MATTATMARKEFPIQDVHALAFHSGRDGGNVIDQAGARKKIIELCNAPGVNIVHLETTEIATAGQKRRVRAVIESELA
jgi:hypothetical protein